MECTMEAKIDRERIPLRLTQFVPTKKKNMWRIYIPLFAIPALFAQTHDARDFRCCAFSLREDNY